MCFCLFVFGDICTFCLTLFSVGVKPFGTRNILNKQKINFKLTALNKCCRKIHSAHKEYVAKWSLTQSKPQFGSLLFWSNYVHFLLLKLHTFQTL